MSVNWVADKFSSCHDEEEDIIMWIFIIYDNQNIWYYCYAISFYYFIINYNKITNYSEFNITLNSINTFLITFKMYHSMLYIGQYITIAQKRSKIAKGLWLH